MTKFCIILENDMQYLMEIGFNFHKYRIVKACLYDDYKKLGKIKEIKSYDNMTTYDSMTSKEIYAIIGWLAVRYELNIDKLWKIEKYLGKLELSYDFIMRVLDDEVYGFYHDGIEDDYDFIYIDTETGRIGIWCEVNGFIAWLDEYNKKWRLENEEEKAERLKKQAELKKYLNKCMEKFSWNIEKKNSVKSKKVKSIKTNGLGTYERDK